MFFSLFLLLGLAAADEPKTVWVEPYIKSDGTYVQGHFRSPPTYGSGVSDAVGVSFLEPTVVSEYIFPTSGRDNPNASFKLGFIGDRPFVKMSIKESPPVGETVWHYLEFSCVKTTDGVIENIDWMERNGLTGDPKRVSLKDANVWIGDYVENGVTMSNAFRPQHQNGIKMGYYIPKMNGVVDGNNFYFPAQRGSTIERFINTCKHLRTL